MPGLQSSSGSLSLTSSDGGASGAVGSGNEDSRVRYPCHDMFDKIRIIVGFK